MARALLVAGLLVARLLVCGLPAQAEEVYDLVIYGGTSSGVAAAVQAARMGRSVVIIEPGQHIGGLTSGGLGATDIGNKGAIGGIAREFYRRVKQHYDRPEAWRWQRPEDYRSGRQAPGEDTMWTFEPHVAEKIFRDMLAEAKVPVVFGERLDLKQGVEKQGARIVRIRMESGRAFAGRMFIDATYEGDLMACAGVSYTVGREANAQYGETLNGVQVRNATKHQFLKPVDPYRVPGDPTSGLLPGVHGDPPGEDGQADHRVQAYCFRMCLTDVPENKIPFPKPPGYDPLRYELLLRYIQTGGWHATGFGNSIAMPNRKTDTNNNGAFSTDNIGMNYDYPDGDYATRERIIREHVAYQQGMMWFLANDPRVPEDVRRMVNRWGLARDEFTDNGGWPHQLYVREARRMVSSYVMTQHNCQGREVADDSVGLAAYTMDSHNTQRYVDAQGHARNEGDVQVGGFPPYPIAYRSIVPRAAQCENLLVPVCLSASHIAYGSIRMEPVFMVLGQSAATAAVHALHEGVAVQNVDIPRLQKRLLEDGQVLQWTGPRPAAGIDPARLPGVVVDDAQAELTGAWLRSNAVAGFVGSGYLHDNHADKGKLQARFRLRAPQAGTYEVRVAYTAHANRASNVVVRIETAAGQQTVRVDQRRAPQQPPFQPLLRLRLEGGATVVLSIDNADTDGHVIVDAAQLLPVDTP